MAAPGGRPGRPPRGGQVARPRRRHSSPESSALRKGVVHVCGRRGPGRRGKPPNRPAAAARAGSLRPAGAAAGRPVGRKASGPSRRPPPSGASPTPCWGFLASASGHPHPVSCFPTPSGKGQPRCGTRWGPLRGALPWVRGPQASSGVRWPPSSRRQDPSPQRGPHAILGAAGPAWLVGVRGLQPLLPSTLSLRRPECTRGSQSHFGGTRRVPPEDHSGRGTPSPARAVGGAGLGVGGAQRGAGGDRGPQGPPPEGGPVWSRVPG